MPKSKKSTSHEDSPDAGAETLTPALMEQVQTCLELGDCNAQRLADYLGISVNTVYKRTQRMGEILGTRSLGAAVALFARSGKPTSGDDNTARGGGGGSVKNNFPAAKNVLILGYAFG